MTVRRWRRALRGARRLAREGLAGPPIETKGEGMLTKPNSRSGTVWSAAASIAAFVAAVAPVVPERYRPLAQSLGGVFAAVAALRARKAGIDAARSAAGLEP